MLNQQRTLKPQEKLCKLPAGRPAINPNILLLCVTVRNSDTPCHHLRTHKIHQVRAPLATSNLTTFPTPTHSTLNVDHEQLVSKVHTYNNDLVLLAHMATPHTHQPVSEMDAIVKHML